MILVSFAYFLIGRPVVVEAFEGASHLALYGGDAVVGGLVSRPQKVLSCEMLDVDERLKELVTGLEDQRGELVSGSVDVEARNR